MTRQLSSTLPWWRRLVVQLVILVLAAMTLPLLALGISNIQTARSQALQQTQLTNLAWAEVVADRIAFHISEVVAELTVLADSPPLRARDWTAARAELERRQAQRPDLTTLTLTDAGGNDRVKVSVTELVLPESLGSRAQASDFLTAMQGKTYLGNVHLVPGAGQRLLVAVPVFDAARQQVVGVLSAELSLRDLLDAVGAMRVGQGGYAYVVDGAGRVIAHPDFSLVLAQADASALPEVQDFLAGMVERQEPEFSSYPSLAGQPVFGVHAVAEPLGWGVVVEQPAAEVLAPVRALTARLSALLGLTVLLSAGLVLFLTDLLARPISQLTQAAQHLATGNLSIRAPAGRRNEVGLLAATFNQMAEGIQQAQATLVASEERYRSLTDDVLDSSAVGIFILDSDFRVVWVNQALERYFGLRRDDAVGKDKRHLIRERIKHTFEDPESFADRVLATYDDNTYIENFECHVLPDGEREERWLEHWSQPILTGLYAGGRIEHYTDITEQVRAEDALRRKVNDLAALYEASRVFLGQIDAEATLENVCWLAVERFGLKMAWVGLVVEGSYDVHPAAAHGFEEDYLHSIRVTWDDSPTGHGPTGTAIRTARAVPMNRIDTDPTYEPWRAAALERSYRSSAALPLLYGEEVLGALNVYSAEPEHFATDRLQVLQSLANLAALGLQKARLREQEQRYAAELEQMVDERTEELRRRSGELTTLYETSLTIILAADLEVVLDRIAEAARSVAQADSAGILLYDEGLDRFTVSATTGWGNAPVKGQLQPVRLDRITRRMLREREPVIVADVLDYPDIHPLVLDSGVRSLLAVPVERQQRLLGVLYVNAQAPGAFDEHHLTALRLFANQAAVAVENARLLQRQQVEARRLRTLSELVVGIVGARTLDRTLDAIAQAVVDLLECDMAAVGLYDPVADEIRIPVEYGYRGFSRTFVEQFHVPAGSGAGGRAFAEGRVGIIPDTRAEDVVIDHVQAERAGIRAMLVGPLQTPEHKLGVLYANQRRPYPFSEEEVALFSILAGQAAVAIENARLYDDLEARSRELAASLEQLEATNTDMLKVLEDLTKARAELEERAALLEVAKERAEEADRLKTAFLATVSHELRTPLASIKGFATTLLADDVTWDADSQHDFLQTIDQEADRLTELISQLLDMSRLEAGTLRIDYERCYLADILTRIEERLGALTARHQLVLEVPPDLPALNVDPVRIGNVLTNLVENAAKFAPAGTKITVTARAEDDQIVVSVADEGLGIAPEHQVNLFERFYRVDSEITRSTPGTGLGLAICSGLVEAHGGRIWVESEPDRGARFYFTLPLT